MRLASIAFVALFALNGVAFAKEAVSRPANPTTNQVGQEQAVDPNPTGSVKADNQTTSKKPRLGLDLNPFSFGTFH